MPSFHKVISDPPSLSTRGPLGTDVPLQLLTGGIPLVPLLGMPDTAQLQATTDTGSIPAPLTSSASDTPVPQPSTKQWCCSSDQGMPNPGQDEEEAPDDMPEEPPHKKWKPMVKAFKEAQ